MNFLQKSSILSSIFIEVQYFGTQNFLQKSRIFFQNSQSKIPIVDNKINKISRLIFRRAILNILYMFVLQVSIGQKLKSNFVIVKVDVEKSNTYIVRKTKGRILQICGLFDIMHDIYRNSLNNRAGFFSLGYLDIVKVHPN